jgi:glyoxylase-like metal-dependent hydrolase (beta-lactamase superfamily II)
VIQGRLDYAQCERVWGSDDWPEHIAAWFLRNGVPQDVADELIESGHVFADFVRFEWNPVLVDPGDEIDGWRILWTPGHADGHLSLLRDGVLIAGDTLLAPITPAIGLYPESRPDPLGDYLETLGRIDADVSYGGHGATIERPAERAREIAVHHAERLDRTEAALGREPRSGYEVSHALFGSELAPIQRRFAVAETLSHLERLVAEGRADRREDDRGVAYTGRSAGGRDTA